MVSLRNIIILTFTTLLLFSCSFSSSFKAGGKGNDLAANSILIPLFNNNAAQGPTTLTLDLTEQVRDYYLANTKLVVNSNEDSDLELYATIQDFYARQVESSISNGTATQMELFVVLNVEYIDNNNEDNNVNQNVTQSLVYSADLTLEEAQDEILPDLLDLLVQQVFNKTVARW